MSTYSPILRTELIGAGEQPGTWGATTNSNFQYIFENAIAGYQAVTVTPTSNNQVLTYVNGPSASPSLNQSVYAVLKLNAGTLGANFNIFTPPVSKTYIIWNNTSYSATFYNSSVIGNTTAAGSGIVVPAGAKAQIWSDGTNFWGIDATTGNLTVAGNLSVTGTLAVTGAATFTSSISAASASLASALPVASGGTGVATLSANGVLIGNGTSAVSTVAPGTSGNLLTSNGTTWTSAAAAPGVLTGALLMWATTSAPSGYLMCDGSAVSRTTYAALYAVIGTTFGSGDGSTTFNVPNYTNRMPYGTTIGTTGGSADAIVVSHTHTATSAVTDPGHVHTYQGSNYQPNNAAGSVPDWIGASTMTTNSAVTNISVATTVNSTGSSGTNANLPPYLGIRFIIKT